MMDGGVEHCTGGRDQDHLEEKEMQRGHTTSVLLGDESGACITPSLSLINLPK